jgi:hypothetical protein
MPVGPSFIRAPPRLVYQAVAPKAQQLLRRLGLSRVNLGRSLPEPEPSQLRTVTHARNGSENQRRERAEEGSHLGAARLRDSGN